MSSAQGTARSLTKAQVATLRTCDAAAREALRLRLRTLLLELRADGWTYPQLGELIGASKQYVHTLLNRA